MNTVSIPAVALLAGPLAALVCARAGFAPGAPAPAAAHFTGAERAALVAYWNVPGRYQAGAPADAAETGP